MDNNIKLRPCPFCSQQPAINSPGEHQFQFKCSNSTCRVWTCYEKTEADARYKWNNQREVIRLELDLVQAQSEKRALELKHIDLQEKMLSLQQSLNEKTCDLNTQKMHAMSVESVAAYLLQRLEDLKTRQVNGQVNGQVTP
jgi:hypothetical protein